MRSTIIAFAVAPLVGVLVSVLVVTPFFGEFADWTWYLVFGIFFAYPIAFLVGLPLFIVANRFWGSLALWQVTLGGIVSSVPGLYLVLAPENGPYLERTWPLNTALTLITGAAAGAAVWLIMRAMRSNLPLNNGRAKGGAPIS